MKRRIMSILVVLSMALSLMPFFALPASAATAAVAPSSGTGTAADPYIIANASNLVWFRNQVNGGKYTICAELTGNVNLNNEAWTPINGFRGTFDGRNHTISNLNVNISDIGAGFFGTGFRGTVKNLHIRGSATGTQYSGGIVGCALAGATIKNCSFVGTLKVTIFDAGGLVGNVNGNCTISDCYAVPTMTTGQCAGGIIGSVYGGTINISKCYAGGGGSIGGDDIGGAVGYVSGGAVISVTDCYFTQNMVGTGRTGMFAGSCSGGSMLKFTRVHYYNTSHLYGGTGGLPFVGATTNNNTVEGSFTLTNCKALSSSSDSNYKLNATDFKNSAKFTNWNFSSTWYMAASYPRLKQRIDASGKTRAYTIYDTQTTTYNLPDYFDLVLPQNQDYTQDGTRFEFTVDNHRTGTTQVWNGDNLEWEEKEVDFDSVSKNTLTINGAALGIGSYPVNITAHDTTGQFPDYSFTLNITVKHLVPVPQITNQNLSYSRQLVLAGVFITDGWSWSDPTICPKNTNTTGYETYYAYEDGKAAYYDTSAVTKAGFTISDWSKAFEYENEEGETETVTKTGIKTILKVPVAESDESPHDKYIYIKDGDTEAVIANATVSADYEDEFPNGHKTDANGRVYADLSQGDHEIKVKGPEGSVYPEKTETITANQKDGEEFTIYLDPRRTTVKLPVVKEKDTEKVIADATVAVTKVSTNKTKMWNDGGTSLVDDALKEIDLPDGTYKLTNATYGYTTGDMIFVKVENGGYKFYTDSAGSALASDQDPAVLHAVKLSEPMYYMKVAKDGSDSTGATYKAVVTLRNIKATYGSFGVRFDPELFTFKEFKSNSDVLEWTKTPESMYGKTWSNDNGYYVFEWSPKNNELNTEPNTDGSSRETKIAEFTFQLKDGNLALEEDITIDTFGIQPWDETKAAIEWYEEHKATSADFDPKFYEYWRPVDTDNQRANLKEGRIEASKSLVYGADTGGFFQASVSSAIGDEKSASFYDVMTVLEYGFDTDNSVIRFHTIDRDTEENVTGATVSLFDTDVKTFGTKDTNYVGRTTFAVDTSGDNNTDFTYTVLKDGYWPVPLSGLLADRPRVSAATGKATDVEVKLEKKIYHVPLIKPNPDTPEGSEPQTIELVGDADLGGEKYAYNEREFHFRIKGAKGFRITKYPKEAYVTINDTKVTLQRDVNNIFTLPAEYLNQEPLTQAELLALGEDYADAKPQPDDEGFRSYNVEIIFDEFEVIELEYLVEGVTNEHGYVTYDPTVPSYATGGETYDELDEWERGLPIFDQDEVDGEGNHHFIQVKTTKTIKDKDTGTITQHTNHKTGTFTFKADEGYMVEKVYINGLQINTFDDMTMFTYTFGDVDMDNNIVVMFWNGEEHSTDSVVTLVVGEYGYADVSSPEPGENDIMFTRRVYLNLDKNLEFTTRPIDDGYELYKVERENEGESRVDITDKDKDGLYSIAPNEGESVTVYVTFRNKLADITPNIFVKSYVYTGQGTVNPAGILIYTFFDSVEIDLNPDLDHSWLARGVMLSPYEDLDNVTEYDFPKPLTEATYRYDSLQDSIGIGAIFQEKAYPIQGFIDLSQKSNVTTLAPLSGATVKFVRLEKQDDGTYVEKEKQVPYRTGSTNRRQNSVFDTEIPAGHWNVYVMKQGYVTYKITDFEMPAPANDTDVFYFGKDNGTQQVVVPLIGSADTGESISLTDAAFVKSGMRGGVSKTVFDKADVDNNKSADHIDLAYVWFNYNARTVEQEYSDFCANGSKDIKVMQMP